MPAVTRDSVYEHHDNSEKMVYINWINRNLFSRPTMSLYLPINPNGEEIFDYISDGVILCEIINKIFPNSIDVNALVLGLQVSKEEKFKNLQLAFETARSFGCQIDVIKVNDIFTGVRQSVLELLWQIFYVGLVVVINYENFPKIEALRNVNESKDTLKVIIPEEILTRFMNHEIQTANPFCREVFSFKDKLNDGKMYACLIDSIAKRKQIQLYNPLTVILKESNLKTRTEMLFSNFDALKIRGFLTEELLLCQLSETSFYKMHLLTVATIFCRFGVDDSLKSHHDLLRYENNYEKIEKETNINKLCRIFLNFISVKPVVTNLQNNCKDGLVFAQVMKLFSPDIFKKEELFEEFNSEQMESMRIHNAAIIIKLFQNFQSIPINDLCPENIMLGHKKFTYMIVYNFMLYWTLNVDKNVVNEKIKMFNEKDLLIWLNSLGTGCKVTSFRDGQIHDLNLFPSVIDIMFPKSINWEYFDKLKNRNDRAIYYVNVARREGFPMFIHPEMIASGDYRSTLLAFAILKEKNNLKKHKCK